MQYFSTFNEILEEKFSDNAWSDDGILRAIDAINEFEPEDWNRLRAAWLGKPEQWQGFAADTLSEADWKMSLPLLCSMIADGSDHAQIIACDSLRTLVSSVNESVIVPNEVKRKISELLANSSGLVASSLKELQRKVGE